jgi:hypothetical protein
VGVFSGTSQQKPLRDMEHPVVLNLNSVRNDVRTAAEDRGAPREHSKNVLGASMNGLETGFIVARIEQTVERVEQISDLDRDPLFDCRFTRRQSDQLTVKRHSGSWNVHSMDRPGVLFVSFTSVMRPSKAITKDHLR